MSLLEELEGKIKLNPYAREFYQLALEYQKLGKISQAKTVLVKGLEKNQGNFQARLLLTKILIAESNFQEAKRQIDRVLVVVPDNITANHFAAEISEALGDFNSALRYYKIVELFEPGRPGIKEKIVELENRILKKEEKSETKKESHPQYFEVSKQEEEKKESAIELNESVKVEDEPPVAQVIVGTNIPEEKKMVNNTSSVTEPVTESAAEEILEESKEDSLNDEIFEEDEKRDEVIPPENSLEGQYVLPSEEKDEISMEIGQETLTDLLEEEIVPEPLEPEKAREEKEESIEETNTGFEPTQEGYPEDEEISQSVEEVEEKGEVPSLSTETLAKLYENQGYPDKAIEIYQHILLREPEREDIKKKIEKLKKELLGMETQEDVGVVDVKSALRGKRIEALKTWLKRIREADNV